MMPSSAPYDVFISYASEDNDFALRLAHRLENAGLRVWYDSFVVRLGDSIRECVDKGLAGSRFGVVILSPAFFAKCWPKAELGALFARESAGTKVILPVWHGIGSREVAEYSPLLADRLAVSSRAGVDAIALDVLAVVKPDATSRWLPPEVEWFNETTMVVLPLRVKRDFAVLIGKHPITNKQYRQFVRETGAPAPCGEHFDHHKRWHGPFYPWDQPEFEGDEQPVVCVSYLDALQYCAWSETQIPSCTIWDFAAFGREVIRGNGPFWLDAQSQIHHFADAPAPLCKSGQRETPFGVSDMFGNIWEWCEAPVSTAPFRPYGEATLLARDSNEPDDMGVLDEELRGGSFLDDLSVVEPFLAVSRLPAGLRTQHSDLGFRVSAIVPTVTLPHDVQTSLSAINMSRHPPLEGISWPLQARKHAEGLKPNSFSLNINLSPEPGK